MNHRRSNSNFKLLAILASCLAAAPLMGQMTTNPVTPPTGAQGVGTQIVDYFSSFDTNLDSTFADHRVMFWTGASSVQNGSASLVNDIGLSYDVLHGMRSTNNPNAPTAAITLETVERNSGVAGTIVSWQAGIAASLIIHDVRAQLYVDGGYDLEAKRINDEMAAHAKKMEVGFAEIGLRVFKALGPNFYAGVGMGVRLPQNSQLFSALVGTTF